MTFNVKCLEDKLKCRIFVVRLGIRKKMVHIPFGTHTTNNPNSVIRSFVKTLFLTN